MKKIITILFSITFLHPVFAQKEINLLKKHEISLLKLLLADSTQNANFVLNNNVNFELDNFLFSSTNIIKKGKQLFLQPLGTGQLYQVIDKKGVIQLNRMDKTVFSGVNFYAQNFLIKDTLFQYGGTGFWQIRGIVTYFSKNTNQWELILANRAVQCFFDDYKDAIVHVNEKDPNPKMYVTNSYYYPNYSKTYQSEAGDSCYVFDFNLREWKTLGKLNPSFKSIFKAKQYRSFELHLDNYYVFQNQLEFYWMNFEKNQYGQFSIKESERLRQIWLTLYNNNRTKQQIEFQFNIGNDLYYAKMNPGKDLEWIKTSINLAEMNVNQANPIYINNQSWGETIVYLFNKYKTLLLLIIIAIFSFIAIRTRIFKRKSIPKELTTILYQNFYNSLTIIEKELIEALYQQNSKGEELSTKSINKIIGVQQKDTLTQNKSRSDHFIKINQKFKMTTQHSDPLIIKNRDKADKRQYNYDLNHLYVMEIEKIMKE